MPSIYRVYYSPYSITKAQTGPIDSFAVRNTSTSWFNAAGISTSRGSPQVSASGVMRLQDVIYKALVAKAGQLRYLENSLNRAYGRDNAGLTKAIIAGTPTYKNIGLTFNGKTYKSLYNEYLTMMDAVALSAAVLRSWSKSTLY